MGASVGGAAIGLLCPQPAGALVGGAATPALAELMSGIAEAFHDRVLSPREKVRSDAAVAFSTNKIMGTAA